MNGLPEVLARHTHADGIELELQVATECPWFEGHFPGAPILPGVVQIGWAAWFAAQWHGQSTPPTVLERIKFKHPIGPGARLRLRLRQAGSKLHYEFLLCTQADPISASSGSFAHSEAP